MLLVYKYVETQADGTLTSVGNPSFIYKMNEYVPAIITSDYSGIFCYFKEFVNNVHKHTKRDFELIECEALEEDLRRVENGKVCVFRGVTPLRIVPREEYANW